MMASIAMHCLVWTADIGYCWHPAIALSGHNMTVLGIADDLLELESPSSMIAEIASGDLEVLSDSDDEDQQDQFVVSDNT